MAGLVDDPHTTSAEAAGDALGSPAGLLGIADPLSLAKALADAAEGALRHPEATLRATLGLGRGLVEAGCATTARLFGAKGAGPAAVEAGDRRFTHPAWHESPAYFAVLQSYLLWSRYLDELVGAAALAPAEEEKARFAMRLTVDALAPTNYLATNPAALQKAVGTGGMSVLRGLRNFIDDVGSNHGMPRQVDAAAFAPGRNMAMTPGKVVYRNRLMELIQYAPQTEQTYAVPLLCSPPWINKYYVMDLAPGQSFVEWAVGHGHTVFVVSYRNPDESLKEIALDDYLVTGLVAALDAIEEITGSPTVNVTGLCLGGTLTAMLAAYLAATGRPRLSTVTLLNTLVDFEEPGQLACFTDAASVERMERKMAESGFLDKADMARTFDLLRANDLIWSFVASNWLMGEPPPAFNLLAWNADSTRMPARMHSSYLRECYLENRFARGEFEIAGVRLDPGASTTSLYVLGAQEDHIAPWRSAYQATQLFGGERRFVLTSSGHIAGIVNPPGGKRSYFTNDALPPDPAAWLSAAARHQGSWWEDWTEWIGSRSGALGPPPALGSAAHPPLDDAPGTYVHEK